MKLTCGWALMSFPAFVQIVLRQGDMQDLGVGYLGHSEFGIEYFEIIQLSIKGIDSKLDL